MTIDIPVITIDGPSGAGKGSIGVLLAKTLSWHFLDSGAIYRLLALAIIQKNIHIDDLPSIIQTAKNLDIEFIPQADLSQIILMDGKDVTKLIRHEECGIVASKISAFSDVRSVLIECQRSFRKAPGLVADGRDMGTVVFPNANLKIFLTATAEERARRRFLQLQDQGISANLGGILKDLVARDKRDYDRNISPLKPDPDAVIVDVTKLSIDEVLQQILEHVKNMHI